MKNTTKIKAIKLPICGKRLFTDFGGIGFYKINVNTLEAINKQCEELGWMQSHAK